MSTATIEQVAIEKVTAEDRFLFDLQGCQLLRNVLSGDECSEILAAVRRAEPPEYDDAEWMARATTYGKPMPTRLKDGNSVRMNGLFRFDPVFDRLIDHPKVLPRLNEFMGDPQIINTWSISKEKGHDAGNGWHRGMAPTYYTFRNGQVRTGMLNVVWFLTDNGAEDGCMTAVPGSHKNNIDLPWNDYHGLKMPGAVPVIGKAGDVFMFSESVLHTGLAKTTGGTRTNLYFNYLHRYYGVGNFDPVNLQHYYMPEHVRERFSPRQKELTSWMETGRQLTMRSS